MGIGAGARKCAWEGSPVEEVEPYPIAAVAPPTAVAGARRAGHELASRQVGRRTRAHCLRVARRRRDVVPQPDL